jgi:hypothetical protein
MSENGAPLSLAEALSFVKRRAGDDIEQITLFARGNLCEDQLGICMPGNACDDGNGEKMPSYYFEYFHAPKKTNAYAARNWRHRGVKIVAWVAEKFVYVCCAGDRETARQGAKAFCEAHEKHLRGESL